MEIDLTDNSLSFGGLGELKSSEARDSSWRGRDVKCLRKHDPLDRTSFDLESLVFAEPSFFRGNNTSAPSSMRYTPPPMPSSFNPYPMHSIVPPPITSVRMPPPPPNLQHPSIPPALRITPPPIVTTPVPRLAPLPVPTTRAPSAVPSNPIPIANTSVITPSIPTKTVNGVDSHTPNNPGNIAPNPPKEPTLLQEVGAAALHAGAKTVGLAVDGILGIAQAVNPPVFSRNETMQTAWRDHAVPAFHEKIDNLCSTNSAEKFDARNDPVAVQIVGSILTNPIGLLNLEQSGIKAAQVLSNAPKMELAVADATASSELVTTVARKVIAAEEAAFSTRSINSMKSVDKIESALPNMGVRSDWVLPKQGGGASINGRWYSEHALERIAPRTPEVMAELESRFQARANVVSQNLNTQEFREWCLKNAPDPRGIPPSVIEAEITHPGTTAVRVVLNEKGHVITVIPGGE